MNFDMIIAIAAFFSALILAVSSIIYLEYLKLRDEAKYNEAVRKVLWNNLPAIVFAHTALLPFIKLYEIFHKRGEP